jgi:hypothetical protein
VCLPLVQQSSGAAWGIAAVVVVKGVVEGCDLRSGDRVDRSVQGFLSFSLCVNKSLLWLCLGRAF